MRTFPVIVMLPFCQQFLQVISRKIYGSVKLSFVCLLGTFNLSVKMRRRWLIWGSVGISAIIHAKEK